MPKGKNFSENDRRNLRALVISKSEIVECKKSDCISIRKKKETWDSITDEFNSTAEISRTTDQLKRLWDNIKTKRKAELAADRREIFKTGGGPPPKTTPPDPELDSLGIATELQNAIDSDCIATLNEESGYYIVLEKNNFNKPTTSQNEKEEAEIVTSDDKSEDCTYTTPKTFQKANFIRNKRKPEAEFSAEATIRVTRSQYLLDLDRTIGALRTQEAEMNVVIARERTREAELKVLIAKEELEYIKAKKAKFLDKE